MTYSQIYKMGYDAAIIGCVTIEDCPFKESAQEKAAWVFGFTEGLRYLYTYDMFESLLQE